MMFEILLARLGKVCPKLRYLSLLGNKLVPHEMLGGERLSKIQML